MEKLFDTRDFWNNYWPSAKQTQRMGQAAMNWVQMEYPHLVIDMDIYESNDRNVVLEYFTEVFWCEQGARN